MSLDEQIAHLQQQIDALRNQILTLANQETDKTAPNNPVPAKLREIGLTRFRTLRDRV